MLEQLSLEGTTILITGGGTGLGREMVRHLARAGADLAIAARRSGPIEEAAQEARALGRRALAVPTDVTSSHEVNRLVEQTLAEFGKVDVLINNSGIVRSQRPAPIWEISDEDWRLGLDTNLSGAFYCARAVSRHMVDRGGGKIINVSSGFGLRGGRDNYIYACAKGGIVQLTRTIATSLSRHGVTCTCIVPGYLPTESDDADRPAARGAFIPVGRVGRPAEIGPIAVFLASHASDYMNGELFPIDGGGLAGGYAPTEHAPVLPLTG